MPLVGLLLGFRELFMLSYKDRSVTAKALNSHNQ
jgi:hypothetical protein